MCLHNKCISIGVMLIIKLQPNDNYEKIKGKYIIYDAHF